MEPWARGLKGGQFPLRSTASSFLDNTAHWDCISGMMARGFRHNGRLELILISPVKVPNFLIHSRTG